jgi:hypothetical protein
MKAQCRYTQCVDRRRHHEDQDTPRGPQLIEVPDGTPDTAPVFCSFGCAIADGWMIVKYETREQEEERHKSWYKMHAERLKRLAGSP